MDENNIGAELVKERETTTGSPCLPRCCTAWLAWLRSWEHGRSQVNSRDFARVKYGWKSLYTDRTDFSQYNLEDFLVNLLYFQFLFNISCQILPSAVFWVMFCLVANISAALRPDLDSLFLSDGDLVGSDGPAVQMAQILSLNLICSFVVTYSMQESRTAYFLCKTESSWLFQLF